MKYDTDRLNKVIYQTNTVNMTECNIGDDGLRRLLPSIVENKVLHSLELCGNRLTDACLPYLVDALKENKSIKILKLEYNMFTHAGVRLLSEWLTKEDCTIQYLELYGNTLIGSKGAQCLAYALTHNKTLTHLGLKNCRLQEEGLYALASVLYGGHNQSLKTLNVANNCTNADSEDIETLIDLCMKRNRGQVVSKSDFPSSVITLLSMQSMAQLEQLFAQVSVDIPRRRSLKDRLSWKSSMTLNPFFSFEMDNDISSPIASSPTLSPTRSRARMSRFSRTSSMESTTDMGPFENSVDQSRLDKLETENRELKERMRIMEEMFKKLQDEFEQFKANASNADQEAEKLQEEAERTETTDVIVV